jgi:hypothetical protein
MATIFSAPQIGDPRATGIKNGGIKAFESDIVYPVSRLTTPDGTWSGGKQLEFRWRSDSSRFWSQRQQVEGHNEHSSKSEHDSSSCNSRNVSGGVKLWSENCSGMFGEATLAGWLS